MYNKILVAIDMSDMGKEIFSTALSLATDYKAQLKLLHVLSAEEDHSPLPIPSDLSTLYPAAGNDLTLEMWRQQWEEFKREGLETLQARTEEAKKQGITAEYQQVYGSPARTICRLAREWQVDLIIIGRRGRSGISEFFLGSVSNYILHHAPCSVLVVQPFPLHSP